MLKSHWRCPCWCSTLLNLLWYGNCHSVWRWLLPLLLHSGKLSTRYYNFGLAEQITDWNSLKSVSNNCSFSFKLYYCCDSRICLKQPDTFLDGPFQLHLQLNPVHLLGFQLPCLQLVCWRVHRVQCHRGLLCPQKYQLTSGRRKEVVKSHYSWWH